MVAMTFRLTAEEANELRLLADRMSDAGVSDLIRLGIAAVVNVERLTGELPTLKEIRNVLGLNARRGL